MSTRTSYSVLGGGGRGYMNIGGWNTTLTDRSTQQQEVPGAVRQEGANTYIYALQGTNTIAGSSYLVTPAAPLTDSYTDAVISPVVFTGLGAVGTDNPYIVQGVTVGTCPAGTYGWYFQEGILTVCMGASSGGVTVGETLCVAESASANVFATCTATAQGIALTTIASAACGQAYVSFRLLF